MSGWKADVDWDAWPQSILPLVSPTNEMPSAEEPFLEISCKVVLRPDSIIMLGTIIYINLNKSGRSSEMSVPSVPTS